MFELDYKKRMLIMSEQVAVIWVVHVELAKKF